LESNFRFIEKNIDVSKILNQVLSNPQDWKAVSAYKNISGDLEPYGFLPLVMAWVKEEGVSPKDTEHQMNTPMYKKYTEIRKWLKIQGITEISRAAFFKLRIDGSVGRHVDEGTYYSTRDRFHLSLQGRYLYHVDGEGFGLITKSITGRRIFHQILKELLLFGMFRIMLNIQIIVEILFDTNTLLRYNTYTYYEKEEI
jgi:hypothetical protein